MPKNDSAPISAGLRHRLRAHDAAAYLGLSRSTLAKLRCTGAGPTFTKLGRVVVYERSDLDAWCDTHGKRRSTSERGAGDQQGEPR
jgi:predicted DNA-binding transcriptional regulator AlpA